VRISGYQHFECQDTKEVVLREAKSRSAKAGNEGHVVEPQGGPVCQIGRRMLPSERSQHPLTSRVSGICEIREREFNPSTGKVASSENARRKVNITSWDFVKGRCQGWTPRLVKW
jgi:hypothetical protein